MSLTKLDQKILEALKEVVEILNTESVSDLRQFMEDLGETDPSVFYGVLSKVPSLEQAL
jgi:hypothetical protein